MTRAYRNEQFARLLTVVAFVFGAGSIVYLITGRGGVAPTVAVVAMALFVYLRLARSGAYVSDAGVRIVNPGRTVRLGWDQVAGFSLRPHKGFPALGFADLVDGSRVQIWGIQARTSAPAALRAPEQAIAGLNAEAERRRG